jgi:hypothetical protein
MARMRQRAVHRRNQAGTRERHSIAPDRIEGGQRMISRLTGAILRAVLVVLLIATPSILLPGTTADTSQTIALLALIAAVFTIVEYQSSYPSLVEFRDAPPFNRVRFGALFITVFALTLILRGETEPSTLTKLAHAAGTAIGNLIDFPYSPVRLIVLMLPEDATMALVDRVRTAAGLSYLVSILSLGMFVALLRLRGWPTRHQNFNVWVNLPTFDPTAGGDVVNRLERDSQINLILGFLLPFVIPAFIKLASDYVDPISLSSAHTMIWTITAWAFLPASLLMRGIALSRVAAMICEQRQSASMAGGEGPVPAH